MAEYSQMSKNELEALLETLRDEYKNFQAQGLKLDMSRGKPGKENLDLAVDMLTCLTPENVLEVSHVDPRNYGMLDGDPVAKKFFAEMTGVSDEEIILGGNSSLNMMYDTMARAMQLGVFGGEKPWGQQGKIKFLCPSPGYDRHFAICEIFSIEMIPVEMNEHGPDMNIIEKYVKDPQVKGIWCVPRYSNPTGITYSDAVVKRFAALKPAADDFRIFWDDAYCVHHLDFENPDRLLNILDECKKTGNENLPIIFSSTSKITFPGGGVAILAASKNNIDFIKKQLAIQTIGPDKINQLRHVVFLKDMDGLNRHMQACAGVLKPKFDAVLEALDTNISPCGIAEWNKPNGGYFISLEVMNGCAKRIISLCNKAGVIFTPAGATYPYGNDPNDSNIRIAPTFPPVEELVQAMELFCICIKIASLEKLL